MTIWRVTSVAACARRFCGLAAASVLSLAPIFTTPASAELRNPPEMIREATEAHATTTTSTSTSPASYFRDLRAAYDPTLQRALVSYLNQLDLMDAVRDERLSVALVDVTDLSHPRMA